MPLLALFAFGVLVVAAIATVWMFFQILRAVLSTPRILLTLGSLVLALLLVIGIASPRMNEGANTGDAAQRDAGPDEVPANPATAVAKQREEQNEVSNVVGQATETKSAPAE